VVSLIEVHINFQKSYRRIKPIDIMIIIVH